MGIAHSLRFQIESRPEGRLGVGLLLALLGLGSPAAFGFEGADELLLFEEIPVVVSASRQAQPLNFSSVPVSILTAEDIHRAGVTTIGELLQFVPGVDVLQYDRNRFAIGVRGFHEYYSDRTLTMVDGRVADNPVFGGSQFYALPVAVADIDRIEIVRGPGGAAWGANAFNGVINIITKKPTKASEARSEVRLSEFGDAYTHLSWSGLAGGGSWRLSGDLESRRNSSSALDGTGIELANPVYAGLVDPSTVSAQDDRQAWSLNAASSWDWSDGLTLELGAAHSRMAEGAYEVLGYQPTEDTRWDVTRMHARLSRAFGQDTDGYVQAFWHRQDQLNQGISDLEVSEIDLEVQLSHQWDTHESTFGANVRGTRIKQPTVGPVDFTYEGAPLSETWVGAFAMDRWAVTERTTFEIQGRLDDYTGTETDWAGRATILRALDEKARRVLRIGAARAYRAPFATLRNLSADRIPVGPGVFAFTVRPPEGDLANETTWSLETGLDWRLGERGAVRADFYYQSYDGLIAYYDSDPGPLQLSRPEGRGGGRGHGAEFEYSRQFLRGRASAWYAYNAFEADEDTRTRAYSPAEHKLGGQFAWDWNDTWSTSLRYRFATEQFISLAGENDLSEVEANHRVDLSASKRLSGTGATVQLGVVNLLNETQEGVTSLGALTVQETPGRSIYARLVVGL